MKFVLLTLFSLSILASCEDSQDNSSTMEDFASTNNDRDDGFTVCGTNKYEEEGETVQYNEEYNYEIINRVLAQDEELRSFAGLESVDNCEDARFYMSKQNEYDEATETETNTEDVSDDTAPTEEFTSDGAPPAVQPMGILAGKHIIKPAVVQLSRDNSACSGVIVSNNHILTAAHCFSNKTAKIKIKTRNESGVYNSKWYTARTTRHPSYSGEGNVSNDIALVTVTDSSWTYPSSKSSRKMRLWAGSTDRGDKIHIYGYGNSRNSGGGSGSLRQGKNGYRIKIFRDKGKYFNAKGYTARICYGDSGGPSVDETGAYDFIYGIASKAVFKGSSFCTKEGKKMYWTAVPEKMSWLRKVMGNCTKYYSSKPKGNYYRCW